MPRPPQLQTSLHATTGHIRDERVRRGFCDSEQIRDDRRRKGYCDTCGGVDPVRCYKIKLRMGGIIREKVPLTVPGKVFNGTCLYCHPKKDPDGHYQNNGRRKSQPLPRTMESFAFKDKHRTYSTPNPVMLRQPAYRNLADSLQRGFADSLEHEGSFRSVDEFTSEDDEYEYVEETRYNIYNEPIKKIVKKKKPRRNDENHAPLSPTRHLRGDSSPRHSPRQNSPLPRHPRSPREEEKFKDEAPAHLHYPPLSHQPSPPPHRRKVVHGSDSSNASPLPHSSPHQRDSDTHQSPHQTKGNRGHQMEEQKLPSLPSLLNNSKNNNNATKQNKSGLDDESIDALAALCAQYCRMHPEETIKFDPGSKIVLPQTEIILPVMSDDISVMTPATCFQGQGSLASMFSARQKSEQTHLTTVNERSSGASSAQQRSMVSHQIKEPDPVPVARTARPADRAHTKSSNNAQDMESYLEASAPNLTTLREIVFQCTQMGDDATAIDTVTQALIHDNATSMSMDLANFCLTTLWVLARKSDENKRKIIFGDTTFDAIIEAMQIYRERSADIQMRACGVLWSLSMDPADCKHVAQGGGCDAILGAMLFHAEDDALQVMALGALKVLSFNNVGKSTLRQRGTLSIVADAMRRHVQNPAVQSDGCVILGNLSADVASRSVAPVNEREVDVVVRGMLHHPDSLEVHEAACFTLMSLASSSANVELIRRNGMTRVALELAYQKHPDDVGNNIFTLLRRLGLSPPSS